MTNHAQLGAILSIVSGVLGILSALGIVVMMVFLAWSSQEFGMDGSSQEEIYISLVFSAVIAGIYAAISILSIAGGIFAYRRRNWGWALAGAIAGSMVFYPAGIAAVIFVSLAKLEFQRRTDTVSLVSSAVSSGV